MIGCYGSLSRMESIVAFLLDARYQHVNCTLVPLSHIWPNVLIKEV
jgi:hypothetical protein